MLFLLLIGFFWADTPPSWINPEKLPQVEIYWDFEPFRNNTTKLTLIVQRGTEKRYTIGNYPGSSWDMREGGFEPPEGAILGALFQDGNTGYEITVWKPPQQNMRVLIVRYRLRSNLAEDDEMQEEASKEPPKRKTKEEMEEYLSQFEELLRIKIPKFANVTLGPIPTHDCQD